MGPEYLQRKRLHNVSIHLYMLFTKKRVYRASTCTLVFTCLHTSLVKLKTNKQTKNKQAKKKPLPKCVTWRHQCFQHKPTYLAKGKARSEHSQVFLVCENTAITSLCIPMSRTAYSVQPQIKFFARICTNATCNRKQLIAISRASQVSLPSQQVAVCGLDLPISPLWLLSALPAGLQITLWLG